MVDKLINKGKRLFTSPQSSIFSAATVIMLMIVVSKILGFVRQRTLFSFFSPSETDLFLAAFELPDLIFEVFVYGVLSASFIPVFTKYLTKKKSKDAWHVAAAGLNILLIIFVALSLLVIIFANPLYNLVTGSFAKNLIGVSGGFSVKQVSQVVALSRTILVAQLFFVVSSFMTGILESHKRFIIPAIAPLFYNLGIIGGTVLLSAKYGLMGPTIGAVIGAFFHMAIQIPFATQLGFRPKLILDFKHPGIKKLAKLSIPRIIELSFFQLRRFVWLFLASAVSGGFTYLKSADLLQTLPIGVFGVSLAKAALPTLSQQEAEGDREKFKRTFTNTLNQILFLVIPTTVFLAVLRVPVVRLVFGADRFDWDATIQTGLVLSAFLIGSFAYAGSLLVSRAFYALHDTKTPVLISIISILVNSVLGFVFILVLKIDTWGIALAYSIAGNLQFFTLLMLLIKKIKLSVSSFLIPLTKILVASGISGFIMFLILKVFDKSVWVKRLSFLGKFEVHNNIPFENFVLDTRYTGNLLALTVMTIFVGGLIYLLLSLLFRLKEIHVIAGFAKKIMKSQKIGPIAKKEKEPVSPPPTDSVI